MPTQTPGRSPLQKEVLSGLVCYAHFSLQHIFRFFSFLVLTFLSRSLVTFFVRAKKATRRRRRDGAANSQRQKANPQKPGSLTAAAGAEDGRLRAGWEQDGGFSRCGATPFLLAEKKWGKETARGNLFRGGSLWTPSPTTRGACPSGFPGGGRETADDGIPSSVSRLA